MAPRIRFAKLSGAGNDFVLVEGPLPAAQARALARRLCPPLSVPRRPNPGRAPPRKHPPSGRSMCSPSSPTIGPW